MIKKATALLALLALCGLLPAAAQEAQEAQEAQQEMKVKAKQAMGEADEMADDAKKMAGEVEKKADEAGKMADDAEKMAADAGEKADEAKAEMAEAEELMDAGATLDEVLGSHYEAIGGRDAWKSVEAVRFEGSMSMGPGMEAPFKMTMKRPENIRLEFTFQGMTGIQSSDGETAWMVMPFMGKNDPEAMPDDMAGQFEEQADIDGPLFDWEAKGHKVELLGKVKKEGTEAYKIKLTRENGDVRYHYLDSEYYVVFKQEGKATIQGQEMEIETDIGDYKELCVATSVLVDDQPCEGGALMLPYSIESKPKGAPSGQAITITGVAVNPDDIAEDYFAMPAKEAAASEGTESGG